MAKKVLIIVKSGLKKVKIIVESGLKKVYNCNGDGYV